MHRPTRFDITVWTIAATLILTIISLAVFASPSARGPRIAYLAPAYGAIQNIWLAYLNDPASAVQVTQSASGIYDFDVSHDGRYIAFSERDNATGLNELMLLSLETRSITPLTNCRAEQADCRSPRWRPGDDVLAYERVNMGTAGSGAGAIRIWLLDRTRTPYETRPLAEDSQFIGYSPEWAANGESLVFYTPEASNPGIMVYNFIARDGEKTLKFIPSLYGTAGSLAPNGEQLVFPDLIQRDNNVYAYLRLADLGALSFVNLTDSQGPTDDTGATWHPDGQHIVIERRYTDERYTRGYQLYWMEVATGATEPLVVDAAYNQGFYEFSDDGQTLVMQRFPLAQADDPSTQLAQPQVWALDMASRELRLVAENAFHPRYVIAPRN